MFESIAFLGLWLDTGVAYEIPDGPAPAGTHYRFDSNEVVNPVGHLGLGASWQLGPVTVDFGAQHDSFIPVNDHGRNQVFVRTRFWLWRPQ